MSGKKLLVEFYYDCISPYSYIAFEGLIRHRKAWDMNLVLKPAYLGGIMKASNNKPPGLVPNRAIYMVKDIQRNAAYHGMQNVHFPADFMEWILTATTVNTQRFLIAVQINAPQYLEEATRCFWQRLFREGKEIMSLECIPEVGKKAGIPEDVIKKCLEQIKTDAVKNQLKQNTEDVLEEGAFGLPTYIAHINGEKNMFFGQDRIHLLAHMAGKPYLGAAKL